jgi:CRP-like cAMP-binding protein
VIAVGILEDESAAYPVFTADQLERLLGYGSVRPVEAGEVLFSPADDTYDLLVVLDGEVEVTEEVRGGRVRFAPHERGQFVGELNLLTGQRSTPRESRPTARSSSSVPNSCGSCWAARPRSRMCWSER